jgi:hypothetical protein
MHASIHSGGTGNIRHSPRNGFNSLLRAPRGPGFLAPVIRHDQRLKARLGSTRPYSELDTSVGVPGPRVFAVRNNAARLARRDRSRIASPCDHLRTRHRRVRPHPTPTFVTTAIRPSSRGGMARKMPHISEKRKCYFSRGGLDDPNRLDAAHEFSFLAQRILDHQEGAIAIDADCARRANQLVQINL